MGIFTVFYSITYIIDIEKTVEVQLESNGRKQS